ncbi:hypothetical protein [Isoalcanivorax indicus]|uniref:hypothetical protein n=1 Tax=Isoalcanivorax indicus TaxID=2202653 RepID=UPI000DB9A4A6|nr:hypothetical protein [Isoalcanivorax indicus]
MIGNVTAWGQRGYTILEEGELDPASHRLRITHYLVADPHGETVDQRFPGMNEARAYIDYLELPN